jgi:hypothetical protein
VRRDVNGGVAGAQNTGIDSCDAADAVVFLHSDDRLGRDRFRAQAAILSASAHISWVGSRGIDGSRVRPDPLASASHHDMLARPLGVHISNYLFRRELLDTYRFDEGLRCREDWDLLYRLKRDRVGYATVDEVGSVRPGDQADRLSNSPEMAHSMAYLREKYLDELSQDRRLLALWELRTAMLYESFSADPALRHRARHWYRRSLLHAPFHPRRVMAAIRCTAKSVVRR